MIVYKSWVTPHKYNPKGYLWHGWYLFGIIPIYLKRLGVEA